MSSDFNAKVQGYLQSDSRQPSWINDKPAWYNSAQKAHAVGKTLIGVGIILVASAAAGAIVFSGFPLHGSTYAIVIGVVGSEGEVLNVKIVVE